MREASSTHFAAARNGAFAAAYVIARRDYPGVDRLLDRLD